MIHYNRHNSLRFLRRNELPIGPKASRPQFIMLLKHAGDGEGGNNWHDVIKIQCSVQNIEMPPPSSCTIHFDMSFKSEIKRADSCVWMIAYSPHSLRCSRSTSHNILCHGTQWAKVHVKDYLSKLLKFTQSKTKCFTVHFNK